MVMDVSPLKLPETISLHIHDGIRTQVGRFLPEGFFHPTVPAGAPAEKPIPPAMTVNLPDDPVWASRSTSNNLHILE